MVPLSWYVLLSAALFGIGVVGVLSRRNIFIMVLSLVLMLNAVTINLVAFSHYLQSLIGQVFAIFVIAVTAIEVIVALAIIIILVARNRGAIFADEFTIMKG
jgi:NADH-quinone oxidoreductase subunit K